MIRRRREKPLVVVDLESAHSPEIGELTVASIHRHVAPDAPLSVVVPGGPTEALQTARAVVVTGSALMLEDVPWADAMAQEIAQTAAGGVPVLAICFGHQMMARHFGGKVESFAEIKKGIPTVRFEKTGPFPGDKIALIHTHRDHVADPGELVPCAEGGFGGVAATRHPEWPLWTIQGHPEWDASIARADNRFWDDVPTADLETPQAKTILRRFGGTD